VLKIDENGEASVALANAKGVGSISIDQQGLLYGTPRTKKAGSTKTGSGIDCKRDHLAGAAAQNHRRQVADGTELQYGRSVTIAAENLVRMASSAPLRRPSTLPTAPPVVAFDVAGPGMLTNRRDNRNASGGQRWRWHGG
jgi:hypothetical protein